MRAVLRKKDTTQNYVFFKHVSQLTTGTALDRFSYWHEQSA